MSTTAAGPDRACDPAEARPSLSAALRVAAGLFLAHVGLHLGLAGRYGYNGDELYFLACGRRLAFGYVDHAPLVPWIARTSSELFGDSLYALRLAPALAGGLALVLTVLLVRRWGGRSFAQLVAGLAVLLAPAFLRMGSILCIPVFEPLFWTGCSYLVVRCIQDQRSKLWLAVGALAGIGLLNKHTMLFWGAGLAVGLLATPARAELRRPWPWLGGLIALAIFLPNLIWQHHNGWATLEFIRAIGEDQLDAIPRAMFLVGQALYLHPLSMPIAALGVWFFFSRVGTRYRLFGWMYVSILAMLFIAHAKPYYIAPVYPIVFAAGAVVLERLLERGRRRWLRPVVLGSQLIGGAALGIFSLPVLPLATTDRIIGEILGPALRSPADLTLEFHEEYGWPEQAATIAAVLRTLPEKDQARAAILTHNYAEAGAIEFFGPALGLPAVASGHMTYFLWGPPVGEQPLQVGLGHPLASRWQDRKSTRLNSSHRLTSRMPSSA